MKHQAVRKNSKRRTSKKTNKNERFIKIALVVIVIAFAFILYKIFDILVLSNERYDLSGTNYYQYFYGIMEEYSGKMEVVQRNDDIELVLENGKVIYLDSTPIYYKDTLGKMLFAKPMELLFRQRLQALYIADILIIRLQNDSSSIDSLDNTPSLYLETASINTIAGISPPVKT